MGGSLYCKSYKSIIVDVGREMTFIKMYTSLNS